MDQEPTSRFDRVKEQVTSLMTEESITEQSATRPLHAFLHFWVLVGRSFVRNRCPVRATALAYTTLLALIPLLAVSLGVSTSLLKSDTQQTRQMIEHLVNQMAPQLEQMPGSEQEKLEARHRVIEQIQNFIANIHSGALGLTGTVAPAVETSPWQAVDPCRCGSLDWHPGEPEHPVRIPAKGFCQVLGPTERSHHVHASRFLPLPGCSLFR